MAYGVTPTGFIKKDLEEIRSEIDNFQRANIDNALSLDDQTLLGQINAIYADRLADLWELGQAVYSSQYPDSANDFQLDEVCSITGTLRDDATKTTGTGEVQLTAGTTLGIESVANAENRPSDRFLTTEAVTNSAGTTEWVEVDFIAEEAGHITVAGETAVDAYDGQLNEISETETGWLAVRNVDAFLTGSDAQEDVELRNLREKELQGQGSTNVDSIRADILRVEGVSEALVLQNKSSSVNSQGLLPHSVWCVMNATDEDAVAEAIFETTAGGIDYNGTITKYVTDDSGKDQAVSFDFAVEVPIFVTMVLSVNSDYFNEPASFTTIAENVEEYIDGLGIGETVVYNAVKCGAFTVSGVVDVLECYIGTSADPTGVIDIPMTITQIASGDIENILVS
ncbi:MAG: hypothetical protein JRD89_09255 [Deltaproteobacteria bacterium]|nr:hypothetical protein [Deltaproteobacteria bacterium]